MSAHLLIAQALSDVLLASPALAGGYVRANPTKPVEADRAQAIAVRQGTSREQESNPCTRRWATVFEVEILARSNTGTDPAVAVDGLLSLAWQRLAAADLTALAVNDLLLSPEIAWDYDAADTPMASATLRLTVDHHTERNTLNVPAP